MICKMQALVLNIASCIYYMAYGGVSMAEVVLVNRTRFTSSLKNELLDQFDQLAKETRIPKSRLFDEDLLKKYAAKDL